MYSLWATAFLVFLASFSPASAGSLEGKPCARVGETRLDPNLDRIVACLSVAPTEKSTEEACNKSGACVWKSTQTTSTSSNQTTSAQAWFLWTRSEGVKASYNIAPIKLGGPRNRPYVTLKKPMPSTNYVVVCNGTRYEGVEEQIYAYNRTTSGFMVQGAHGGGEDPTDQLNCVLFGN